jgi:hypothetical protein
MRRRALLLAIADYDPLQPLAYVKNDTPRLAAALGRSGFQPKEIAAAGAGAEGNRARELTTTRLREAIGDFLDSGDEHDDMLVFFSGHGIEIDGRRLLLPQDFTPKRQDYATDLLSDSWISIYARCCKARSVLVIIDACREGARFSLTPAKSTSIRETESEAPLANHYIADSTDGPTIAFIYSCGPQEQSGQDIHGSNCSAFTRAFAEAIELENGPAELGGISEDGRHLLQTYSGNKQTLTVSGRDGRGGPWQRLIIKEDEATRFRDRLARSCWALRLAESDLFLRLEATLPGFATQLRAIAMRAEEHVAEAHRVLPIQRWRDDDAWFRQAARINYVFLYGKDRIQFAPAEIAVLLAVPFVYETVLATAEIRLVAGGAIPDPEASISSNYLVNAWSNYWRSSDAATIRRGLISRGKHDTADDQACWSLVTFCHNFGELWDTERDRQGRSGWAVESVTATVAQAPLPSIINDRRISEILSVPRLLRLARLMHSSFDDVTLDAAGGNQSLEREFSSGELTEQLTISEIRLAHLLNLGSRLALDLRRMPSLLAEHVGTDEVLSANWLRDHLKDAEWHQRMTQSGEQAQDSRWFDLKLDCFSDAVDATLLSVVDALESYRTRLLQRQDVHASQMRDLLPAGFTASRLNSVPTGWHPTRPPLRFELDRTRIISLLMGQQLYGERWPALRELYQNALDACRYRRAAEQLAIKDGRLRSGRAYCGQIAIRFGKFGGRRFVECVDNGVGMADRHIRRLFAYAGQRFVDSHEFHIDQARWDVADIKFYPNSRFGVGVLSYFMLAEELDIVSRRWAPPSDFPSGSVRARIIGSGSLFRLESEIDPARLIDDHGTAVRLYLREDAPDHEALLNSILDWLALPEVTVSLYREASETLELPAGQPTQSLISASDGLLLAVPGSETTCGAARVFLAPNLTLRAYKERAISENSRFALVDGIKTKMPDTNLPEALIVNFTEDLPKIQMVDRRSVDPDIKATEMIQGWVRREAGNVIARWSDANFSVMHATLRDLHPDVAANADFELRKQAIPTSTSVIPGTDLLWPMQTAGVSGIDPDIASDLFNVSEAVMDFGRCNSQVSGYGNWS